MQDFAKLLIYGGISLIVIGLIIYIGGKYLPLGKLPGDFSWKGDNWGVYFPLGSSLLISLLLTILLNLLFR